MKHKPFENWILDEITLTKEQTILLKAHLKTCPRCQQLHTAWAAREKEFKIARLYSPQPGFTQRWQTTLSHRRERERSRQVRRTLILLTAIMTLASAMYMIQNHLLATWIVSTISLITSMFFNISKFLAGFNAEMNESPLLFYGFTILSFGAVLSFMTVIVFFVWNLLRKNRQDEPNEAEN